MTSNPVSLSVSFLQKNIKFKYKQINKMEKKTTIVISRNIVNKLCKRKTKIGDTYDKIINDLINTDESTKNNGKI